MRLLATLLVLSSALTSACLLEPGGCRWVGRGITMRADLAEPGSTLTGEARVSLGETKDGGRTRRQLSVSVTTIFSGDLAVVLDSTAAGVDTVISLPLRYNQSGRLGDTTLAENAAPHFIPLLVRAEQGHLVFEMHSTRRNRKLAGPLRVTSASDWSRPSCS